MADRVVSTTRLVVRRARRITPHLIRITASPVDPLEFARFVDLEHTDCYVKVVFGRPGVRYPEPFDMARARAELPREEWPALRTYTVREVHRSTAEIIIDFVYHGDVGLAGPWAASARPGTELLVVGPGGNYAPDLAADWHLLVGDDAALPAIAASLARVPTGVPVHAIVEVTEPGDCQDLSCPGQLRTHWLFRADRPGDDDALVDAVRALRFLPGRVHAFVHGEASAVKQLRRHLLDERGLTLAQLSISGYWRRGFDDETHRAAKAVERDVEEQHVEEQHVAV